jgi:hypothetical protein
MSDRDETVTQLDNASIFETYYAITIFETYYAIEHATGRRVVVLLWDDAPGVKAPAAVVDADGTPVIPFGVRAQAQCASGDGTDVSDASDAGVPDIPYNEVFLSPEREGLLAKHSNVIASTLCYQPGARGWTIVVGVTAKGYIPIDEAAFPPTLDVDVEGVTHRLSVDVRSAWLGM